MSYPRIFLYISLVFYLTGCTRCATASGPVVTEKSTDTAVAEPALQAPPAKVPEIQVGAAQLEKYLPLLQNKRVALVVNQTSLVGQTHLVDTLLSRGVKIVKIFAPEHGFRGDADAGAYVKNATDVRTGLPILSLYGKNKKPGGEMIQDVDVLIFDIQDVGVRFYTYISTMHYIMEAAAENNKSVIILDRPNPNGSYVDGPVLEPGFESFVGMHPIPIVHGLTVGELAQMINGEGWLSGGRKAAITVVPVANYNHEMPYSLPVKPSPNLPNDLSIQLYPSLGLFEGTNVSVGRGTETPFQVIGSPFYQKKDFSFVPKSMPGAALDPPYKGQTCYGKDLTKLEVAPNFTLAYLVDFYQNSTQKDKFFNNFFEKLAGNALLSQQVKAGKSEEEIRESWNPKLQEYKQMREKYLLYE